MLKTGHVIVKVSRETRLFGITLLDMFWTVSRRLTSSLGTVEGSHYEKGASLGGVVMSFWSVRKMVVVLVTALFTSSGIVLPTPTASADASASFDQVTSEPFGNFGGVEFQRHTGLFQGKTALGEFRVPFEIVAATDPGSNNGTVLVEPPHFVFGPAGRDLVLGWELLFGAGYSHASVGYGTDGLIILDPTASGLMLAGSPVTSPGVPIPIRSSTRRS